MRYLLDTHSYIWYVENHPNLSKKATDIIDNPDNLLFLSIASLWEITIKSSLGKLNLKQSIMDIYKELEQLEIKILQISKEHLETLYNLEYHHNDPFDRLIISQTISNKLIIISNDKIFSNYSVKLIW
jgi:PIN domain nuclease of toxin-antitoxin system